MLPPGGESDHFLIAKETKLLGGRRRKVGICNVLRRSPYNLNILDPDDFAQSYVCLNLPCISDRREAKMQSS